MTNKDYAKYYILTKSAEEGISSESLLDWIFDNLNDIKNATTTKSYYDAQELAKKKTELAAVSQRKQDLENEGITI